MDVLDPSKEIGSKEIKINIAGVGLGSNIQSVIRIILRIVSYGISIMPGLGNAYLLSELATKLLEGYRFDVWVRIVVGLVVAILTRKIAEKMYHQRERESEWKIEWGGDLKFVDEFRHEIGVLAFIGVVNLMVVFSLGMIYLVFISSFNPSG